MQVRNNSAKHFTLRMARTERMGDCAYTGGRSLTKWIIKPKVVNLGKGLRGNETASHECEEDKREWEKKVTRMPYIHMKLPKDLLNCFAKDE